jgi:hypothetical protein
VALFQSLSNSKRRFSSERALMGMLLFTVLFKLGYPPFVFLETRFDSVFLVPCSNILVFGIFD